MLARIQINRHIVAANKKASQNHGYLVDNPAISIRTYKGTIYAKKVEFLQGGKLIQNGSKSNFSGATIWLETTFESLVIDGKKATSIDFN